MWGWSSWEASLISRRNRSAATLTSSSGCRILSATGWPPGSRARKIRAFPPLPISRSTSYRPSKAWRTSASMSRRMTRSLWGTPQWLQQRPSVRKYGGTGVWRADGRQPDGQAVGGGPTHRRANRRRCARRLADEAPWLRVIGRCRSPAGDGSRPRDPRRDRRRPTSRPPARPTAEYPSSPAAGRPPQRPPQVRLAAGSRWPRRSCRAASDPPPRMPTRASTAPEPGADLAPTPPIRPASVPAVGVEHEPRTGWPGRTCVAPAPVERDADLERIRLAQLEQPLAQLDPAAGQAPRVARSPRCRAPAPARSEPAARPHPVEPRRLGRALGFEPRDLVRPARRHGPAPRGRPASPPGAPVASAARSRSRSRTCDAAASRPRPGCPRARTPGHDARCPARSAGPTAPAPRRSGPVTVIGRGMTTPATSTMRRRQAIRSRRRRAADAGADLAARRRPRSGRTSRMARPRHQPDAQRRRATPPAAPRARSSQP